MQTDAEDIAIRRCAVESSRDRELEGEGDKADGGGHVEEFVFARETGDLERELSAQLYKLFFRFFSFYWIWEAGNEISEKTKKKFYICLMNAILLP